MLWDLQWMHVHCDLYHAGQLCTWAESHGLQWAWLMGVAMMANKGTLFVMPVDHAKRFEAHKPVFCRFQWIGYTYELLRCLDVKIWRFSLWPQTKLFTLPLAHVLGVTALIPLYYKLVKSCERVYQWFGLDVGVLWASSTVLAGQHCCLFSWEGSKIVYL